MSRQPARTPPPPRRLTRREREIMDAVFALGEQASAEAVRARLSDPPSSSAVRPMLPRGGWGGPPPAARGPRGGSSAALAAPAEARAQTLDLAGRSPGRS